MGMLLRGAGSHRGMAEAMWAHARWSAGHACGLMRAGLVAMHVRRVWLSMQYVAPANALAGRLHHAFHPWAVQHSLLA